MASLGGTTLLGPVTKMSKAWAVTPSVSMMKDVCFSTLA